MRKWTILFCTLLISATTFAANINMNSLTEALKTPKSFQPNLNEDVAIVYGGEDISRNISATNSKAFA